MNISRLTYLRALPQFEPVQSLVELACGTSHLPELARNLAGQSAQRPDPQEPSGSQAAILQAEVDALLDYEGGLANMIRGALWMKPIATFSLESPADVHR